MHRVLLIAVRDFRQTVLTKAFLFGVLGVPVLLVVITGIAGLLTAGHRKPPVEGRVVIVSAEYAVTSAVATRLSATGASPEVEAIRQSVERATGGRAAPSGSLDGWTLPGFGNLGEITVDWFELPEDLVPEAFDPSSILADESLLAIAVIPSATYDPDRVDDRARFRLIVPPRVESETIGLLERRIGRALADLRVERAGIDGDRVRSLLSAPGAETVRRLPTGELRSEDQVVRMARQLIIPIAFAVLLWAATLGTGQHLLMSTIEEKSNRVMEVLLSAVSPTQLLAGKILGQSAVGLIVVGVYSAMGILGLLLAARADLVQPIQLVYLFVYFILAYLMVASLMAAVGSAVSDLREANSLLTPVMLLLMVPMMLWMPISRAPNGAVATIASFVPPAGPFTMILRVTAEEPIPLWQIPATIVVGGLCVAVMIWMAGRIFRVGILLTGKPPTPLELCRWVRAR